MIPQIGLCVKPGGWTGGAEGWTQALRENERGSPAAGLVADRIRAGPVGHPPTAVLANAPRGRGRPWPPPARPSREHPRREAE
jgi:hypothetical protein